MVSLLLTVAGASCKRKDMIRESQQERVKKAIGSGQLNSGTGLNQEQSLQRAGDTRWGSHYKTLKSLSNLYPEVIEVLDKLRLFSDITKLVQIAKHFNNFRREFQ